ncbi:MAG: DUF1684 domain-containing protein [Actinomycetota bacterium]|nr:DUF1684 domain-containing protein [Actinomycetota bacterium]
MSELDDLRRDKDEFFGTHPQSPLTDDQKKEFQGLAYFPENPQLVIEGDLDTDVPVDEVHMPTSTGGDQTYTRAGKLHFEVDGKPAEVILFASPDQRELFLPFRDATAGKETYGAGRYVEIEPPEGNRVVVDFNTAYNPYCAYNSKWSCPIPPGENWLSVPIEAGEKNFPGAAY